MMRITQGAKKVGGMGVGMGKKVDGMGVGKGPNRGLTKIIEKLFISFSLVALFVF